MRLLRTPIHAIDALLAVAAAAVVAILLTGGMVFHVGGHRVSALHATNATLFLFVVGVPRMVLAKRVPLLGLRVLEPRRLAMRFLEAWRRLHEKLCSLDSRSAWKLMLVIVAVSGLIKVLNAWHYYGFVAGDDVEIHEMTFARLFGWQDYRAWNLRNSFYPMTFIYPAQALAHRAGVVSEAQLVFVGRLVVVALSLATLILVYESTRLYFRSIPVALCAVTFLAGSKLHTTFSSSVLPRSVAASFVVLAFWMLVRERQNGLTVGGAALALGIGSSLRFGEASFMLVAPLYLVSTGRRLHAVAVALGSVATLVAITAISDLLYWGEPFYSLANLIQFTFVDGLSTRGFQPPFHYLTAAGSWTNYFFLALVAYSLRWRQLRLSLWALLPVVLLSLLPHKEARYLVPVMPFFAMLAGFATWRAIEKTTDEARERRAEGLGGPHRRAAVLATIVFGSFLFEADGMRFRRSESSVDVARYLRSRSGASTVAIQNLWTAGGEVYLWPFATVVEASPEGRATPELIEQLMGSSEVRFLSLRASDVEGGEWEVLFERLGLEEVDVGSSVPYDRYRLLERRE